jgi:hypothetical protein
VGQSQGDGSVCISMVAKPDEASAKTLAEVGLCRKSWDDPGQSPCP